MKRNGLLQLLCLCIMAGLLLTACGKAEDVPQGSSSAEESAAQAGPYSWTGEVLVGLTELVASKGEMTLTAAQKELIERTFQPIGELGTDKEYLFFTFEMDESAEPGRIELPAYGVVLESASGGGLSKANLYLFHKQQHTLLTLEEGLSQGVVSAGAAISLIRLNRPSAVWAAYLPVAGGDELEGFAFTFRWGFLGSSYDSRSGVLIRSAYEPEQDAYTATVRLTDAQLRQAHALLSRLNAYDYPESYDLYPGVDIVPYNEATLVIWDGAKQKRISCLDVDAAPGTEDEKGRVFSETCAELRALLTSLDAWKAFPEVTVLVE